MCLKIGRKDKAQIAEEDIVCYKILEVEGKDENQTLIPLFHPYKPNGPKNIYTLGERNPKITLKPRPCIYDYQHYNINEGYHSYRSAPVCCLGIRPYEVIVECFIPKGSEYYVGRDSAGTKGYTSEELVVKSIIERFTNQKVIDILNRQYVWS